MMGVETEEEKGRERETEIERENAGALWSLLLRALTQL